MSGTPMLIGAVAERLGINPKTIRYYERSDPPFGRA